MREKNYPYGGPTSGTQAVGFDGLGSENILYFEKEGKITVLTALPSSNIFSASFNYHVLRPKNIHAQNSSIQYQGCRFLRRKH